MTIIDATIRLVPGVLGDEDSSADDSFSAPRRWLECAEYTRPREYRGLDVPPVLLGGNHQEVDRWREENSRQRTQQRRKDLLEKRRIKNSLPKARDYERHGPGKREEP